MSNLINSFLTLVSISIINGRSQLMSLAKLQTLSIITSSVAFQEKSNGLKKIICNNMFFKHFSTILSIFIFLFAIVSLILAKKHPRSQIHCQLKLLFLEQRDLYKINTLFRLSGNFINILNKRQFHRPLIVNIST